MQQTSEQSRSKHRGPAIAWDRVGISPLRFNELQQCAPAMSPEEREAARAYRPRKKLLVVLTKVAFVEMMSTRAWEALAAARAAKAASFQTQLDNGAAA